MDTSIPRLCPLAATPEPSKTPHSRGIHPHTYASLSHCIPKTVSFSDKHVNRTRTYLFISHIQIAFTTRNIRISTPDGLRLGAWHILPKDTHRTTLEQIRANEPFSPRPQTNEDAYTTSDKVNAATDAIFEDTLAAADKVILYFHGQVGTSTTLFIQRYFVDLVMYNSLFLC